MTLEEAMTQLEKDVALLDDPELPLEKAMEIFEEGVKLTAFCQKTLESYRQRITVLKKTADGVQEEALDE